MFDVGEWDASGRVDALDDARMAHARARCVRGHARFVAWYLWTVRVGVLFHT